MTDPLPERATVATAVESTGGSAVGSVTPDDGWRRLHPLTPLLRGGRLVGVVLAVGSPRLLGQVGLLPGLLVLLGVLVVGCGYGVLAWRATRWGLVDGVLRLDSGVLMRRTRRVPLDRLQAVDVVRGVAARIFGLAELRLEVVGGQAKSEAPFAYLSEPDAQELRRRLLAASRHRDLPGDDDAVLAVEDDLDEQPLLAVPLGTLFWASVIQPALVAGLALLVVLVVVLVSSSAALPAFAVLLPLWFALGSAVVNSLLGNYGFRLARSGDDLRIRRGLLQTRSQTVPPDRVQALQIVQPLAWRPFGWVRLDVDIAGYSGSGEEGRASATLLPVAPRATAEWLGALLMGAARGPDGVPRLDGSGLLGAPARARWRAPLQHLVLGAGLDAGCVVLRRGRLRPVLDVVPLEKVQSVRRVSGPWQRRLRLASVHVDTVGARLSPVALHRDAGEAELILQTLVAEAGRARARRSERVQT